ncbi:MAG: AraC family transcriptional regulator [Pseudomonadota bacterium]
MDLLDDVFDTLNLRGVLYFRTEFSAPWSVTVPDLSQAARFHLVVQGACIVIVEDGDPIKLGAGDMIMIPQGRSHVLADRAGRMSPPLETVLERAGYDGRGVLSVGEHQPEAETQLICGHYTFRDRASHPILDCLPNAIVITAAVRNHHPWLDDVLRMMAQRSFSGELGSVNSVKRLSEIVFMEVIRAGIAQSSETKAALEGFRDAQIGRALEKVHRSPEHPWTVADLASEAGMSRSAFAKRFTDTLGVAPMKYLSDWRLQRALAMLEDPRNSVQRVAAATGYRSAAAFSRAFSSRFGIAPGEYRKAPA